MTRPHMAVPRGMETARPSILPRRPCIWPRPCICPHRPNADQLPLRKKFYLRPTTLSSILSLRTSTLLCRQYCVSTRNTECISQWQHEHNIHIQCLSRESSRPSCRCNVRQEGWHRDKPGGSEIQGPDLAEQTSGLSNGSLLRVDGGLVLCMTPPICLLLLPPPRAAPLSELSVPISGVRGAVHIISRLPMALA